MRGAYNTRQKRELFEFLKKHELEHYTVDEFVAALGEEGVQVGRTTAYRYLESMAEQGEVRKYLSTQGIAQYQRLGAEQDCSHHFHLLCQKCGMLQHVDCDLMENLVGHIRQDHAFSVNMRETVLTGLCAKCMHEGGTQLGTDSGREHHHHI